MREDISASYFDLPEKVLQFGSGVLLRGLPDYFIDKANKHGIFNGRVIVVKSTSAGDISSFEQQDNLYTHCIRGLYKGKEERKNIINASISRTFSAVDQWNEILACASNPDLQVIISNTTEVGIQLTDDNIFASPPASFPGKLLAFLYQRYKLYHGDLNKGMVIIPTELIPDNGYLLQSIVLELSHRNALETRFIDWLENANYFCNSLVDRIVPGKPKESLREQLEKETGYDDELMIISEAYRLWAIETSSDRVKEILSFSKVDQGVIITSDITDFRELKLRLLNGTHTFSCGLAFLLGFSTVEKAMNNSLFSDFVTRLMTDEIGPSIVLKDVPSESVRDFMLSTIDRFRNPAIEHKWLSITTQYTAKMMMRNIPLIKNYIEKYNRVPELMSLGFAAYIVFMKPAKIKAGEIYGERNNEYYLINDVNADRIAYAWEKDAGGIAEAILSDNAIWGENLNKLPGLTIAVQQKVNMLLSGNILQLVQNTIG
ncbi:MAG: tagaturonate reductase [Chitinophagaceae bacterium]|nr:tagaturonate reductase [Chitinophagaceae bacterium]